MSNNSNLTTDNTELSSVDSIDRDKRVMVAMSGGIDSSVAALILQQQGYEVCGATMKLYSNEDIGMATTKTCCSLEDINDARSVAARLGFYHYVFNFGELFEKKIIEKFADSYDQGLTPNPCIDCNRFIKFRKMIERASLVDMGKIATGHYARIEYDHKYNRYQLRRAVDKSKDQTYVLYNLTQVELAATLFPLGDLTKQQVRELAAASGLRNADKPDSQDICFVPDGDYAAFLKRVRGLVSEPGDIVDKTGRKIGRHQGLINYTTGQRKGLGIISGQTEPLYVIRKEMNTNRLIVGAAADLYTTRFMVNDINLISCDHLDQPLKITIKARHTQQETPAIIRQIYGDMIEVELLEPIRAITPGQAAVFYDGEYVVGGGTIANM